SDVNQGQCRPETIANAFRFRQHLAKTRRERAGDSDGSVGWIDHVLARGNVQLCARSATLAVPEMNAHVRFRALHLDLPLRICAACDGQFTPGVLIRSPTATSM